MDSSSVSSSDFPTTWDGSPAKFTEKATLQTFSFFQLFWFAGNNLCDSATKSRIESQLSQQEGKTVTCSATTGLGAFVGTCDWWCDVKATTGINCQGDNNKCSIQDKCVNNQCVPVTCGSNQYVSNHGCNEKLPTQTCTDSDGGDTPLSKGSTYLNGKFVATDQCSSDGRMLQEKYCASTIPNSRDYSCTYGCSGGACLEQKITSCTGKPDGTIITSYCDGNTAKKSVCFGQVEQTAQNTCSNIGKTCMAGECVTPSGGGTGDGGGTGGTGGTGGEIGGASGDVGICCKGIDTGAKYGAAFSTYSYTCPGSKCLNTQPDPSTCDSGNTKIADKPCESLSSAELETAGAPIAKTEEEKNTITVDVESIRSIDGEITELSDTKLLASLCVNDAQCKSNRCDDSTDTVKQIRDNLPKTNNDLSSSVGIITTSITDDPKTNNNVVTATETFKKGTVVGVCVEKPTKFDFGTFFKDNQTLILVGVGIVAAAFVLPKMMGK